MKKEVTVSVAVTCYNHQDYIAECLESLLSQKTDFDIEILVHDDASTDNSQKIIKEYESKYPDIIKPVYQTENQYSKGVLVLRNTLLRATGEYLAICEGDDFWIGEHKLQKQVDYMRDHPECALCCHAAKLYSQSKKEYLKNELGRSRNISCDMTAEEIIEAGGGLIQTASMLYRRELDIDRPDYITSASISDYPLQFYLATCGTVHYIDEFLSAYRVEVPGSWSSGMKSIENREKHVKRVNNMLREADEYHKGKYHKSFEERILKNDFEIAYLKKDWDEMLKRKYSKIFKEQLGESQTKLKIKMKLKKMLGK